MTKSNIKYRVTLTSEERKDLKKLISTGRTAGYRIRHAQMLLALDEIPENAEWADKKIAAAYGAHQRTIGNLRKRFVEEGLASALERKKRETPPVIKIDGKAEAQIIAIACSAPPDGRSRWTLQLIADRVVALGVLESVSPTAIADHLKKTKLSLGCTKNGVSPSNRMTL
ncbi:hypothetical protein AGMMS50268_00050 [Spirochaetia bacterium]|nr:hypothetical protein AGMMS50268_00050 [Spirochaetia bacterium]